MPEIQRDEVRLVYRDEGEGEAVLLIHGHTLDHRVWNEMSPELVGEGLRVIRPDLRGHGGSARPESGYHLSDHAADMEALLDAVGVRTAAIVGFSLGGGIALELALERPGRVGALVLVAPVMPDRPFEPAFMDNLKQVARSARGEGIEAAMLGPWLQSPLLAASLERPGVREQVTEMVRDFPGAEYLAARRDAVARDWTVPDRLGELRCPAHVVVGARELPGFTAFADEAWNGIPGAAKTVVDDAGHLLPLEAPEALVEVIVETVRGAEAR